MNKNQIMPSIVNVKNKKLNVLMTLYVVVTFIMICVLVAGMIGLYFHGVKLRRELTERDEQITKIKIDLSYSKRDTASAQAELELMKMKMGSLNTSSDLIARDIELYILKRYRRVPKIVAKELAKSIMTFCKEEDVSPELVVGIIEIESQFNPMARNEKSGAIGSMQIMPEWHKKLGLKSVYDLYDIPVNIRSGIKILKIHINEDAKGDLAKGLYFYVGKDSSYAARVFQASGKFAIFRSTVDDDKQTVEEDEQNGNGKEEEKPNVVEGTKESQ